jgi:hypothetical protein
VSVTAFPRTSLTGADSPWTTWRAQRLERAGFASALATELAADRRVDLHPLLELIDRGCPPELAARILSPDGPSARR